MCEEKKKRIVDEDSMSYAALNMVNIYKDKIGPNPTEEQKSMLELRQVFACMVMGIEGMMANSNNEEMEITKPVCKAFSKAYGDSENNKEEKTNE